MNPRGFHIIAAIRGDIVAGRVLAEFAHPNTVGQRCMKFNDTRFTPITEPTLYGLRNGEVDFLPEGVTELCSGEVIRTSEPMGGQKVSTRAVRVVIVSREQDLSELATEGVLLLRTEPTLRKPCELRGNTFVVGSKYAGSHLRHMVSTLHDRHFSSAQPAQPRSLSEAIVAAGVGAEATPAMA